MLGKKNNKKFCAAPWIEGVLSAWQILMPCCRCHYSFGNFVEDGLKETWHSRRAVLFREKIINGVFPNEQCVNCVNNGTQTKLSRYIDPILDYALFSLNEYAVSQGDPPLDVEPFERFKLLCSEKDINEENQKILDDYFNSIREFHKRFCGLSPALSDAFFQKLNVAGHAVASFLRSDLHPEMVGPARQVNLISKCNARCIQCIGTFTGELVHGMEMNAEEMAAAFTFPEHLIDFFMNGSEFLFFSRWKQVAQTLAARQVRFSLSTNGILLTKRTIDWLFEKKCLSHLNISLDGACKETVEAIRVNVNFDKVTDRIRYLFSVASQNSHTHLGFSFVLMKRNYEELPAFFHLINELRGAHKDVSASVLIQTIEGYDYKGYASFLNEEHLSRIPEERLRKIFSESASLSQKYGITCSVFYSYDIDFFVKEQIPFPTMPLLINTSLNNFFDADASSRKNPFLYGAYEVETHNEEKYAWIKNRACLQLQEEAGREGILVKGYAPVSFHQCISGHAKTLTASFWVNKERIQTIEFDEDRKFTVQIPFSLIRSVIGRIPYIMFEIQTNLMTIPSEHGAAKDDRALSLLLNCVKYY